jgi:hypothetical protein
MRCMEIWGKLLSRKRMRRMERRELNVQEDAVHGKGGELSGKRMTG